MPLNERQKAFADYYIELGVAETAAIKAGYSEPYARGQSYKLLANVGIKKYIEERMVEKDAELVAKQDEVLKYLTRVMRRQEMEHTVVTVRSSRSWYDDKGKKHTEETETAEVVQIPARLADANKAAELLGKRYMMWVEKQSVDANHTVTFVEDLDD